MKYFFILSLTFLSFSAKTQLLDPYQEWFGFTNFFNTEKIKEYEIKSIRLDISNKKDDQIFYDKGEFLEYEFTRRGLLASSIKRIQMTRGYDTSSSIYMYDPKGRLIFHNEFRGPFNFQYVFEYDPGENYRSIKLRPNEPEADTLYDRIHQLYENGNIKGELISNRNGKSFLEKKSAYSKRGHLIEEKMIYLINHNEIKTTYSIEFDKLIGKHYQKEFDDKRDIIWKYQYMGSILEQVEIFKDGILNEKIAFTYEDDLPKAIILRNFQEKFVRIYRCNYEFY